MSTKRRRWIAMVVVVLGLAAGSRALQEDPSGRWLSVERRDLVVGVELEGELKAVRSASLGPPPIQNQWNFKISYLAPDGKEVREGQPVIRFDPTELQQNLQQKISERDSAEKELEKLVTDLKIERRDLELQLSEAEAALRRASFSTEMPRDVVAAKDLETALIDQRMAKLQIEQLKRNLEYMDTREASKISSLEQRRQRAASEVEELEAAMEAMTVKAPRDGTVIIDTDRRRQKVKVGDQVWRARKVLEIPDLSSMQIEAEIAEADAGRLKVGQRVTFHLDAHPDLEFTGRVETIRKAVQSKSHSNPEKVIRAVVALDATDTERMRPGMRLRGTVEIERLADTVVVPQEAVFTDGGGAWVWSKGLFGAHKVEPELGTRNDRFYQVISGLEPGDPVLAQDGGKKP